MHAHNSEELDNLYAKLKFHLTTTTYAQDESLGMVMWGVSVKVPGLPGDIFMNIPVNSDGEHTISSTTYPAISDCSLEPEAVSCESCCPSGGPVMLSIPGEGRMSTYNHTSVKLITSFLHHHHTEIHVEVDVLKFDGSVTQFNNCTNCGGGSIEGNNYHILP